MTDKIKSFFSLTEKLDAKQFTIALLASIVVYLITCWVLGFVLAIVGLKSVAGYVVVVLSLVLLARVGALVKCLLNK